MPAAAIYTLLRSMENEQSLFYGSHARMGRIDAQINQEHGGNGKSDLGGTHATNHILLALLTAIMHKNVWGWKTSHNSSHRVEIQIPKRFLCIHPEIGYVYVVPRTPFTEIGPYLFHTTESVVPHCAVTVPPKEMWEFLLQNHLAVTRI